MKIDCSLNDKNHQIFAIGKEKSIRIYDTVRAIEVSTVLPLPIDESKFEIKSIAYGKNINYIFILLNQEIWIFYAK